MNKAGRSRPSGLALSVRRLGDQQVRVEVADCAKAGGALGAGWVINTFWIGTADRSGRNRKYNATRSPRHLFFGDVYLPERVGRRLSFGGCAATGGRVGSGAAIVRWITPVGARES